MSAAVKFVNEGGGLREAANLHGVPHETLRRRVVGMVDMDSKPGPATVFSKEEKDRIAKCVIVMADMGFGLTCDDIQCLAFNVAGKKHPFQNDMAGRAWLEGILKPLTLRNSQPLSYNLAVCANPDAKLVATYARLNLLTKPMQIFNVDKSGTVVHKLGKVVTELGRRSLLVRRGKPIH